MLGIPLTVLARALLLKLRITILFPVLVYPSLNLLFTFVLWLTFFS